MNDHLTMTRRGKDAQTLLANETFQRVMRETEARLVEEWKAEGTEARRESLHAEVRALGKFLNRLKSDVTNGRIAERAEQPQQLPIP